MKIMITGSGGFVGGYLMRSFHDDGHEILATYRNHKPGMPYDQDRLTLIRTDLSQKIPCEEATDIIIHCAGRTSLKKGSTAREYVDSNVTATMNVSDYGNDSGAGLVVYLSSLSVYGDINEEQLSEDSPIVNPGLYGMTKYLGERILKDPVNNFSSLSIRLPGVVGKGYFLSWMGTLVQKMVAGEPVAIYNPDALFNNIVDLFELKRFISHMIQSRYKGYETVNLAASRPLTINHLIELLLSLTGSISKVETRAGNRSFWITTDCLENRFNYIPATTKTVIARYINENKGCLSL